MLALLEEQWAMTKLGALQHSESAMMVFRRLLELSLHQADSILHHPCCTSIFFRLMNLALQYYRMEVVGHTKADAQASLLFVRILNAALLWFSMPPRFYQGPGPDYNSKTTEAVQAFWTTLEGVRTVPPMSFTSLSGNKKSEHMLWPQFENSAQAKDALICRTALLKVLLKHETDRLKAWDSPESTSTDLKATAGNYGVSSASWVKHTSTAWDVSPALALALTSRFPTVVEVEKQAMALIASNADKPSVRNIPSAALLLAKLCKESPAKRPLLENLAGWECASLVQSLTLMDMDPGIPEIRLYALRSLHVCDPEDVAFYLPQLVQALRHDSGGELKEYLKAAASQSHVFCHRLVWGLQSEETPPEEAFNPEVKRSGWEPPQDTGLWGIVGGVKKEVLEGLAADDLDYLNREFKFFDDVTKVSGLLKKYDKADRPFKIGGYLKQISMPGNDLYLPTNPDSRVVTLLADSGTPMQSAAKVPILVAFKVEDTSEQRRTKEERSTHIQACIFKVGDDCRQDVMALQVIELLKVVFTRVGLDLYLAPYGVVPTGYECGIIEVVPNSASRAGLGETSESGLFDIFQREFGPPGSPRFEEARRNFIKSSAGYAVASFLLQAKDRHNGNILLDTVGNLVHIDFGFVLEISPGNNMRFESAAFKLSHEMTQLLDPGAQRNSPAFKMFEKLCIQGYLAARTNVDAIMASVSLMVESGLPCFGRGEPIKNLYNRFHMEKTDHQATEFMRATIADAYDKWTTRFYDVIQWYQQGIEK
mmetsp:Transcript_21130/g.58632  ORF Transcript_21130/g.58632 Transcript_21130/m.58632 type:complete len:765 (+) Transcript_21130:339-2633(+)